MTRSGLRSTARAVEAHPAGHEPTQPASNSSDEDDGGIAPDAKRRRPASASRPTESNRRTRQDERQLRPRRPGAHEGDHQEQLPGKNRGAVVEVQLPLKRRAGLRSGNAEASAAFKSTKRDGQGGRGAPSQSDEQQNGSREAEEQLQKELREHDPYDFEGSDSDAGEGGEEQAEIPESEHADGQHGQARTTRGKSSAFGTKAKGKAKGKAKAKAKLTKGSRQQRTGSVDLATPDEDQAAASPTPEEREGGDESNDEESGGGEADSGKRRIVNIPSGGLKGMVELMGHNGWTKEGRQYAKKLLPKKGESNDDWLSRIGELPQGPKRCKDLYAEMRDLLELLQAIPKVPDLSRQIEHLRKQKEAINEAVNAIQTSAEGIVEDMKKAISKAGRKAKRRPKLVEETVNSLYLRIIPLLVLCLKQAFLVGTEAAIEDDTPAGGIFIACTIQPQLLTIRQIAFLYNVLLEEVEQAPPTHAQDAEMEGERAKPEAKQRRDLGKHLGKFQERLEEMKEELKRRADDQKRPRPQPQQSIEYQRLEEAARQESERSMQEARDFQRQLWIESMRRMGAEQRRDDYDSKHGWQRRDEYYEKHGWYLKEDEKVLEALQESASPDVFALRARLPRRSLKELQDRANQLRESSRLKFEAKGLRPPPWCYAPEARR